MTSLEIITDLAVNNGFVRVGDKNDPHLRAVAEEFGVKIRKRGCQSCINEAYLTIRSIILSNSTKKNTNMAFENYELVKHSKFSLRVGKMQINNPLAGKKGHGRIFDFNTPAELLFEIWQYNSTGYKEFFDFVPKKSIAEAHNEAVELLDAVEPEIIENEDKPKKRKKSKNAE